ncbi:MULTISPECIES: glycosyl hydrolase 115 family protein [unclassified Arcicella]|uniref:glycosyl hydrolase 115 family protein n=1 Tax=unclassified Arcicella TaxID=2644986 RepID=UPI00285E441F|nr:MULTISPECIES: glycosyl hydrolase 115 family protein [unclassified Arcicella]MDR6560957.1 hypothetical protein [Arcicella sp. BE51]MDR6810841.1 hypothetical protein [Arcicella sp. BE140]MDR6822191.1 hypothetical protein [Arcicella sp. BE139]
MKLRLSSILLLFSVFSGFSQKNNSSFEFTQTINIVYSSQNPLVNTTAQLFKQDIEQVFGVKVNLNPKNDNQHNTQIILRIVGDKAPVELKNSLAQNDRKIAGQWEVFSYSNQSKAKKQTLIITGSNARGLAYGVFELSKKWGVNPWYFWADVPIAKLASKKVIIKDTISAEPSVKYRGIFINDEDWGLQPWAAKTFDTQTKDIGPATYAKVFELLLRLKANIIWPAMHPSTKAFYHFAENKEIAKKYGIVMGTSHAEPMMRNNVDEWIDKTMGDYNYFTNKDKIINYWESRIQEIKDYENFYTLGMRGKHDSGMEGVKDINKAVETTEEIIGIQRDLLKKNLNKPLEDIPQTMTLYKEVLHLYENGMKVPDDITLMWPDDNYGYIKNLSNETERKRKGGSGVYYHISYWGRPHDYLWLGTTHPALIHFEMNKAYEMDARKIWIVNVGDIKSNEYGTQLFLDMAYNMKPFQQEKSIKEHLCSWTYSLLKSTKPADLLWQYYQLAFVRKPEFMGWSQTEPTRATHPTDFSATEVDQRLKDYVQLEKETLENRPIDKSLVDAYFQLVEYPILAASEMNQKFLYLDKFYEKPIEQRDNADENLKASIKSYQDIQELTSYYNNQLSGGKWKFMMDASPRNLPVFNSPEKLLKVEQKKAVVSQNTIKIPAGDFISVKQGAKAFWKKIAEPSFSGSSVASCPFQLGTSLDSTHISELPTLTYQFNVNEKSALNLTVVALPLHPLQFGIGQKIGIQIDDQKVQFVNFQTYDRSEEWKQNVLTNTAKRILKTKELSSGEHTLKIFMIDAGVVLDHFLLSFN